jgi:hypothetical protein
MNWGQIARHTATAIGIIFLVAAGVYFAVRLLMIAI